MKLSSIAPITFKIRLWWRHAGLSNVIAFILCVGGLVAWLWGIPYLKQQRLTSQIKLQQLQTTLNKAPETKVIQPTQSEQRLNSFYSALGEVTYVEQQVATLFALAKKNGLTLQRADYKLAQNNSGHFYTYTVTFPVTGQYNVIRHFCEQVLQSIPFAALDELNFKRNSISNNFTETQLRFTFFLTDKQDGERGLPTLSFVGE